MQPRVQAMELPEEQLHPLLSGPGAGLTTVWSPNQAGSQMHLTCLTWGSGNEQTPLSVHRDHFLMGFHDRLSAIPATPGTSPVQSVIGKKAEEMC